MSATPATKALERAGVEFETTEYEPPADGGYGDAVVAELGLEPAAVGKTLVVTLDDRRHVVAVVSVERTLDLKAVARAAGAKRAAMCDAPVAERITGYVVGGISPFGHRSRLEVFVDADLAAHDTVHVSGGRRGLELSVATDDLLRVTAATVAPLAR